VNITRVNINIQKNVYVNARVKDAVVTVHKDSFFKRNPVSVTQGENPFLRPVKVSGPPTEKPFIPDKLKKPFRPIKEIHEKIQPERRVLPRGRTRITPSVENESKVSELKRFNDRSEKNAPSKSVRNRNQSIERPDRPLDSFPERVEKTNSSPIPMRERVRVESPSPVKRDSKGVAPNDSARVRSGKPEQPDSFHESVRRNSTPSPMREGVRVKSPPPMREGGKNIGIPIHPQNQVQALPHPREEKASAGKQPAPDGRSFPAADSRGQAIQQHRGTSGRIFEEFQGRRLR
jgi:hypothetical protein